MKTYQPTTTGGPEDKDAMRASYQAFYDEVEKRFGEVMSAALGTLYPDVKMISGAVLKVIKEDSVPELSGTTMKYTVHLTAEVDTDNIDFKALMAKKDEVEKLQQERDALKKQNEELDAEEAEERAAELGIKKAKKSK